MELSAKPLKSASVTSTADAPATDESKRAADQLGADSTPQYPVSNLIVSDEDTPMLDSHANDPTPQPSIMNRL
jgi:hypothetical protein